MTEIQNTGDRSQLLVYRWASILICCGVIFVIVPTLFPYDFFFSEIFSQLSYDYLLSRVARPDDIYDIIANVFLFIPFGFGIGCLTGKHKLSVKIALVVASFASFGLTFFVEFLQIFLPTRNPSYVDLTTNTTGGLVGFFCFQLFGIQLLKVANIFLSVKILRSKFMAIFMAIAYLCFIIPLSLKLPNKLELWQLKDWDVNFPLVVGNELTGDRSWRGQIQQLCIGDRMASETEIVRLFSSKDSCQTIYNSAIAAYNFTGATSYPDLTGNLPDLIWHRSTAIQQPAQGIAVNSENWLQAETAKVLNEKIKNSSQFTLSFIIATNDTKQDGPARIISLSPDIYNRNLTIGQWQKNLSIRLRTQFTGSNGNRPEFIISNFFSDTKPHQGIITYDGRFLSVYLDNFNNQYLLELTPETTLFWSLTPRFPIFIHINNLHTIFYRFSYYFLVLLPLFLIGFVNRKRETVNR